MSATSLPVRSSPPAEIFRFRDIPGEIRNKIYAILLTSEVVQDEIDSQSLTLNLNLEVQILRVCRWMKAEAEYILRANLFVKVTFRVPIFEFSRLLLVSDRVPHAILYPQHYRSFKAHVISHEVTLPQALQEPPKVCVFLFRDLTAICARIQDGWLDISQHRSLISHIVTLRDPYPTVLLSNEIFLSEGTQEKLVAPYRSGFRDFPHFHLKGATSKKLRIATKTEVMRPAPLDPEGVLSEIESLKAEGNLYFTRGDRNSRDGNGGALGRGGASEYWDRALLKIQLAMQDPAYKNIRDTGGKDFLNRMTALSFDLNSNKAQDYLACMRYHADNQYIMDEFGAKLSDAVYEAFCAPRKYPGSTWQPTSAQTAKLAYRKAVRCRIGREPLMLTQAEAAIQQALSLKPGDAAIKKEAGLIAQWSRQIRG